MYIGGSMALIALGAILRFGVADSLDGINLAVIGLILMIVGAIGLVVSLIQTAMVSDGYRRRRGASHVETTYTDIP
jgi:hypothetical protein